MSFNPSMYNPTFNKATGKVKPGGFTGDVVPSGYRRGQIAQFTPQQMQLHGQGFESVDPNSFTSRLARGEEGMFEELEAPALRQFSELQGGLASRFSGMGMGARRSSGFQLSQNQAAQDFAQQLQSQRMGLQRQAIMDLSDLSNRLLNQRPYERFLAKKDLPFWKQVLLGGVDSAKAFIGTYAGEKGKQMAMG